MIGLKGVFFLQSFYPTLPHSRRSYFDLLQCPILRSTRDIPTHWLDAKDSRDHQMNDCHLLVSSKYWSSAPCSSKAHRIHLPHRASHLSSLWGRLRNGRSQGYFHLPELLLAGRPAMGQNFEIYQAGPTGGLHLMHHQYDLGRHGFHLACPDDRPDIVSSLHMRSFCPPSYSLSVPPPLLLPR